MPVDPRLLVPRTSGGSLPVVASLTATVIDYDTISLSWNEPDPVENATLLGYTVEYSTDGSTWSDANA